MTRVGTWGAAAGSAAVIIAPLGHRIGALPLGLAFALVAVGFLALVVGALLLIVAALRGRIAAGTERLAYGALASAVSSVSSRCPPWCPEAAHRRSTTSLPTRRTHRRSWPPWR